MPGPLGHAAWAVPGVLLYNLPAAGRLTSALVDMRRTFDALGTLQRLAIVSAIVFGAASGLMTAAGAPDVAVFIVSAMAIAAFAAVIGQCVDQIGEHMGPGPTGLLQSSVGNLPELFVSIFAFERGAQVCRPVSTCRLGPGQCAAGARGSIADRRGTAWPTEVPAGSPPHARHVADRVGRCRARPDAWQLA